MKNKVLVADGDIDNRTIARVILEASGFEVVLAFDGGQVLDMIRSERPVVAMLDLSMPRLRGGEVARHVRNDPSMDKTAVIALIGRALSCDQLKTDGSGCDDYLAKPCQPRELVAKVKKWIRLAERDEIKERSR